MAVDITDRKWAEEELKAREAFLDRVIDQSPFAIFITDTEGVLQRANPALKRLLNLTDDQLVGQYNVLTDPLTIKQGLLPLFRTVYDQGRTVHFTCDWDGKDIPTLDLKNSNSVSIEATMFPIHSPEGELTHVVINWIDITDRKIIEAEREKLQAQLRQSHKMEAVGTLAGGIAHDFNNLLQAISGYIQMLLFDKQENDPEYQSLEAIQNASGRAAQLVQKLLLFSRKVDTEKKPLELNQEVEQAIRILERTIPKMIDIEFHPGNLLWAINADHVQIEQILLNLGGNAADAMPDGGKLILETENVTLEAEYAKQHIGATQGKLRPPDRFRQRPGHGQGDHGSYLRSVLHDQGHRPGEPVWAWRRSMES